MQQAANSSKMRFMHMRAALLHLNLTSSDPDCVVRTVDKVKGTMPPVACLQLLTALLLSPQLDKRTAAGKSSVITCWCYLL